VDSTLFMANLERRNLVASFTERIKQGQAPVSGDANQIGNVFTNQVLRDNFSTGQFHQSSSWK
jgi:hypothetical protein